MGDSVGTEAASRASTAAAGQDEGVRLDDATLVARARDGDVASFEALVRRYQRPIFQLALRMLGSHGDAEDIVQDCFITVWRRLDHLQTDAAFVGWLYRMGTNACLNALRTRARRPAESFDPDTEPAAGPGAGADPEHAAQTQQQFTALSRALETLTPPQRACWLLYEVHGRSYDEIAQTLGTTSTAVRGRIARARARLVEVMQPWR